MANNGTIVFNGNNTYSGATTVSTGKLYINGGNGSTTQNPSTIGVSSGATLGGMGTVNGLVTVASGGILEAGQGGTGVLTLKSGLTFNGAATVNFLSLNPATTSPTTVNASLVIGGTLNTNSNTVTIDILGSIPAIGNYALIGATGVQTSPTTTFTLGTPLPNRATGTLVVNSVNSNELDLDVTAISAITWTGNASPTPASSGSWDTGSINWVVGSTPTNYNDSPADAVIFDDTPATETSPSNQFNVAITGAGVHPASVTFNANNNVYTISGNAIAGSTGLNVNGSGGKVVLENTNTFTGATSIGSTSTLQLGTGTSGQDGSIGNTSGITVNGSLVYDLASSQTYTGVITGSGSVTVEGSGILELTNASNYGGGTTITGTLQLGNGTVGNDGSITGAILDNGVLTLDYFGSKTVPGAINGTGTVTKNGAGSATLGGNGTYSGGTFLNTGTLDFAGTITAGVMGSATTSPIGTGTLTINAGTTIDNTGTGAATLATNNFQNWNGNFTFNGTQSLNLGTGAVQLNTSLGVTQVTVNANTLTVGAIFGSIPGSALTKAGNGTLVLSGNNTYNGATTISAGTLQIGNGGTTGSLNTSSTITDNANLVFNNTGILGQGANFSAAPITGSGTLTQAGAGGTLVLTAANSYTGVTTISAGTLQVGSGGATGALGPGSVFDNATLAFKLSGPTTVANQISGSGSVVQAGAGTTTLGSVNGYSGGTTISSGTLAVGAVPFGASPLGSGAVTLSGGTLALKGQQQLTMTAGLLGTYFLTNPQAAYCNGNPDFHQGSNLTNYFNGVSHTAPNYVQAQTNTGTNTTTFNLGANFSSYVGASSATWTAATTDFAAMFNGFLNVPTAGAYTFGTNSDDGSVLFIDGNLVVNANQEQGPTQINANVTLTAGVHSIVIGFFQDGGGYALSAQAAPGSNVALVSGTNDIPYTTSASSFGLFTNSGTTGTSQAYSNNVVLSASSTVTVSGSPLAATLGSAAGTSLTVSNSPTLTVSSPDTSGSAYSLTLPGTTTLNSSVTFTVQNSTGSGAGTLTLAGNISDTTGPVRECSPSTGRAQWSWPMQPTPMAPIRARPLSTVASSFRLPRPGSPTPAARIRQATTSLRRRRSG